MCERACMANMQGKYDTELLRYGRVCMLESEGGYYKELSNTITNFNYNNNTALSNMNIREATLIFMIEYEEGVITDAENITSDTFSHASSS